MRKNSFPFYLFGLTAFACIVFLSGGCKVGPDYKAPQVDLPKSWTSTVVATNTNVVISVSDSATFAKWWTNFNDTELVKLVESALKENLDLKIAIARIQQARASYGMTRASLFPSLGASAAYDRFYQNRPSRQPDLFRAGVDALWEVDLFGGNRRGVESAMANIAAAMEYYRDVRVSLAAEVALNYIQLRTIQQQIAIARDNLKAQRRTLSITQQRFGAGFVSRLDVANAEAQAATTESQIPVLESSARQTIHNISILLGKAPGELVDLLNQPSQIPSPPPGINISMPSELLRRRPDIRRAEAQLHSATAKIGVATADLFPKFTITGSFSFQENTLPNFFSNPVRSGSVGPGVSWDIFRGGAIKSNIKLQEFLRDEAFINYQKTVLNALAEVENAIVSLSKEQEHSLALQKAVESNRQAVEVALKLYSEGQADFLNVLNAQRSLLSSEDALAQSKRNISTSLVSLYKALGGDWQIETPQEIETKQKKN